MFEIFALAGVPQKGPLACPLSDFHRKPLLALVEVLLGVAAWGWQGVREGIWRSRGRARRPVDVAAFGQKCFTLGLTPPHVFFFNLKIFFTFLLLLKGTNSEGFAFRGRRGGDAIFS